MATRAALPETWAKDLAAGCALLLGAVVLFAPGVLAAKVPAFRDMLGFTIPSRALWRSAVIEGHLPQWNPYVGVGFPVLASPVYGAWYPPHALLLVGSLATAFTLLWVAHAFGAAIGGYVLARVLGCRPVAASSLGLFWMAGGYAVSMWGNGEKVLSCAWMPWIALACVCAMRATTWLYGAIAGGAALAMMALAGDPFLWFDALLFAVPLALSERAEWPARRVAWRAVLVTATAAGTGVLFSAPALVPALWLRAYTARRAALPRTVAELWSLHPARLLELVVPGALGPPSELDVSRYAGGVFADDPTKQALPWAISVYAGAGVWLLAWLAGKNRRTTSLACIAVGGLLLAFGRHTPFHHLVCSLVPPLALARYPEKHVLVTLAALATLAALGLERALAGEVRLRWPLAIGLLVPSMAIALAPGAVRAVVLAHAPHAWMVAAALVGACWLARRMPRCEWLVWGVLAADLVLAAWPNLQWAEPELISQPGRLAGALMERPPRRQPFVRVLRTRSADYLDPATLPDNAGTLFGIGNVAGHDSTDWNGLSELPEQLSGATIAQLLAIRYLLLPSAAPDPGLHARAAEGGWVAYDLPIPPTAWLATEVVTAEPAGSLALMREPSFAPTRQAIVEASSSHDGDARPGGAASAVPLPTEPRDACQWMSGRSGSLEYACDLSQDGMFVASQAYAPGWRATVDGEPAEVLRTNAVLCGISLAAGRHTIRLEYATPGLGLGLALFAAGAAGAILACVVLARRAKNRDGAEPQGTECGQ